MMAERIFIDTSGFFSLLSKDDQWHEKAVEILGTKRYLFVTSDAVIGEACTLLKARRKGHLSLELFNAIEASTALHLEFIGAERFWKSQRFFTKHLDQRFSFVDCSSFVLMEELQLRACLTHDRDFAVASFQVML